MKRFKSLFILVLFTFFCLKTGYVCSLVGEEKLSFKIKEGTIISPLPTSPQIVERGGIANIVYFGKEDEKIKVFLDNRYGTVIEIPVISKKYEGGKWYLDIRLENLEEHLYDILIVSDGKEIRAKRALKVVDRFPSKFYFVHITDLHFPLHEGGYHPSKISLPYWTSEEIFPKLIEEINLINPEFVLVGGDCITSGEDISRMLKLFQLPISEYSRKKIANLIVEEYLQFLGFLNKLEVPTYVVPGNHDMTGVVNEISRSIWETYIGKRYFSFNFGKYYFAGLDNSNMMEAIGFVYPESGETDLDDEQTGWLKEDLQKNDSSVMKILFLHIPIDKTDSKIKSLIKEHNISLILAGHLHRDKVSEIPRQSGRFWIETKSMLDFGGYRVLRLDDGKLKSHSASGTKESSFSPFGLKVQYKKEKNKVLAEIENLWNDEFENATLKFEIPKNKRYKILNGELEKKFVCKDKEILFVKFRIKPKDKTSVEVVW